MFFKLKKLLIYFLLILFIIPINIYAYSDYIIASGKTIGIELNSKGIMVVGMYEIDGVSPGKDAGIKLGDKIVKIEDEYVDNINDMVTKISSYTSKDTIKVTYLRNNKENITELKLIKGNDNVYKTGLYVKDKITGIGTLTYIDPNSKFYGALGHEIVDKNTSLKIDIKDGKIFKTSVNKIIKSKGGTPGEKNATFYNNVEYGTIEKNTASGIFGTYNSEIDGNLYKVANVDEIKMGDAKILTVLNDESVNEYDIKIVRINDNPSSIKNIQFDIVDEDLLKITGGVVQGMSGSPIIQEDKIVGAVTHVVVDDPTKGYGIFITNMLEEMESGT